MQHSAEIPAFIDSMLSLRAGIKKYIQRRIREDGLDLTYEMLQVLGVLWMSGEMNQQEIADKIQKNKASLTSLLDNLSRREFIERREDPGDRRNKIISLTKAGKAQETRAFPIWTELYDKLHNHLGTEQIKQSTVLLNAMAQNLEKELIIKI